jgi:hypothetical protein
VKSKPIKKNTRTVRFRTNHGKRGVVYVLENPGLREGWRKIGCSTRSGSQRAKELNADANTGTPGVFHCVFECETIDCGLAEQRVFQSLAEARRGKFGQEYFEVSLDEAKLKILKICRHINEENSPPPPPPPPSSAALAPAPVVSTIETVVLSERPLLPAAPSSSPPKSAALQNRIHPQKFCGHCRTLVLPKPKFLFLKECPNCANKI